MVGAGGRAEGGERLGSANDSGPGEGRGAPGPARVALESVAERGHGVCRAGSRTERL